MKNLSGLCYARDLLILQFGVTILIAACGSLFGVEFVKAVLLAGVVYLVPVAIFAAQFFLLQDARFAKQIVNRFYKGEALKLLSSVILFAIIFQFCKFNAMVFFIAYGFLLLVSVLAPILRNK